MTSFQFTLTCTNRCTGGKNGERDSDPLSRRLQELSTGLMASLTVGDMKWKKRRLALAKAAKMRAAKLARTVASLLTIDWTWMPSSTDSPAPPLSTEGGSLGLQN